MSDVAKTDTNGNTTDNLDEQLARLDAKWSSVSAAYARGDVPRDVLVVLLREYEAQLRDLRFEIQQRIENGGAA